MINDSDLDYISKKLEKQIWLVRRIVSRGYKFTPYNKEQVTIT